MGEQEQDVVTTFRDDTKRRRLKDEQPAEQVPAGDKAEDEGAEPRDIRLGRVAGA